MRLFAAITVPPEVQQRLYRFKRYVDGQLRALGVERVSWVPPEQMHLTLKFFGEVEQRHFDLLIARLDDIAREEFSFSLALGVLGAFPDLARPRTLWIGLSEGAAEIKSVAQRVASATSGIGDARPERYFVPHITLARVKRQRSEAWLLELMRGASLPAGAAADPARSWQADHMVLYRSDLTPSGPRYRALHQWRFRTASY